MPPGVTGYQDELKLTALKILKDPYLAQDTVQDVFLYALENGIDDKQTLIQLVKKQSLTLHNSRLREPDTLHSGSYDLSEGQNEETIWKKRSSNTGDLQIVIIEDLDHAVTSIKDYKGKYLPFAQAREFAQSLDLKNAESWKTYKKNNPQIKIPSSPREVYGEEWKGWLDFLGNTFFSYDEFLAFVRTVLMPKGVNSPRKFKAYCKDLPKYIPTNPNAVYKKDWTGWGFVFNSKRKKPGVILGYSDARAYVRANFTPKGIDTLPKYRKVKLPDFLPAWPHDHYKGKGWIDSADFFGSNKEKVGLKKTYLPYKKAREWVRLNLRICGITTGKLYKKYIKGELDIVDLPAIPADLPPSPTSYYGATFSWGDFLGTLKVDGKKKNLYSYSQCKNWNKNNLKEWIKGQAEWAKYKNGGYKDLPTYPDRMPLAPFKKFTESGDWVSWEDFLGFPTKPKYLSIKEHKSRKKGKRDFWPYAQARQYMIDVIVPSGITTLKEYLRLEKKPANIPLDPKHYYEGRGWVNAAHFMGLEEGQVHRKKATQDNGKYLSYIEAKRWVKENLVPKGIDSYYLYRQNASALPENMPAWPHICYKGRGWVDIYDFMSKLSPEQRRKENPKKVFMSVDEARRWITTNLPGVDSYEKWVKYRQGLIEGLPDLHPNIPKQPNTAYGRMRVWQGWEIFLTPIRQAA